MSEDQSRDGQPNLAGLISRLWQGGQRQASNRAAGHISHPDSEALQFGGFAAEMQGLWAGQQTTSARFQAADKGNHQEE
jgi:hypothetical protein